LVEEVPVWRIIRNDYLALLLLILSPAALVGYLFEGWPPSPAELQRALVVAAVVGLASGVVLWKRVERIRETLRTGLRVPAKIVSVWFHKDRGRLEFEYTYAGLRRAGVAINKNAATEALREGQPIDLAVSPERPDKPLVLGLYLEAGFKAVESARR
jgi:hypothetical protein